MQSEELHFRIHRKSKLTEVLNGKEFETENDFLELLEDYFLGNILESSDVGDYVPESEVFSNLMTQV